MENNKNILSIRIKNLRTELGLTQEELAFKLGLKGKSSIANYESDKITPSDEVKLKMCKIFDCSMDYLMGKSDFKTIEDETKNVVININQQYRQKLIDLGIDNKDVQELLSLNPLALNHKIFNNPDKLAQPIIDKMDYISNTYSPDIVNQFLSIMKSILLEEQNIIIKKSHKTLQEEFDKAVKAGNTLVKYIEENNIDKLYMCPVYGQISAGQPNWAEECIEGRIPIDPNLMNIVNPEEHFFLRVNGESMNKVVKNGAYALIHKQDTVEDGEIAVVLVNGYNATLKKFSKQGDFVILEPMSTVIDDPEIKTQIYDKNTSIKILGKYIGKFEMNK